MKRIAILTSGGDAPGMNAAVRALTRKAIAEGIEVLGYYRGFDGLLHDDYRVMDRRDVGSIVNRGGTMLKTARCLPFIEEENQKKAYDMLIGHGVDGVVVVGGDGSMKGAEALSRLGMPTITIPGTIDNDMNGTDYTIGFDTTVNTVLDAVSRIRDTTTAHDRVAIVEVMGRHSGHIAINAGLACGAELVLVPENPLPLDQVVDSLLTTHANGKTYSIILVAEGAYSGYEVCDYVNSHTEFSCNVTVLGYLQRGGAPSAKDAIMAALMSEKAIDCLLHGNYHCLVGSMRGDIVATPYTETANYKFPVDKKMYKLTQVLGY